MRVIIKDTDGRENIIDGVRKVMISTVTDDLMTFYSGNTDLIHINKSNVNFFTILLKRPR